MRVIVIRSFAGPTHGSWGAKDEPVDMPEHTARMAIKAGFAKKAPVKRRTKKAGNGNVSKR